MAINWADYADKTKAGKKRAVHIKDGSDEYIYWPVEDKEIADLVDWYEGIALVPLDQRYNNRRYETREQCDCCGVLTSDYFPTNLDECAECVTMIENGEHEERPHCKGQALALDLAGKILHPVTDDDLASVVVEYEHKHTKPLIRTNDRKYEARKYCEQCQQEPEQWALPLYEYGAAICTQCADIEKMTA